MDSGFCSSLVIAAIRAAGARFSVTASMNPSIRAAIARIPEDAWTPVKYPQAIWDGQAGCRVSDAEVAGTGYTAFTSKKKELNVTARLIVRRVRALNKKAAGGQDELFPARRYHLPSGDFNANAAWLVIAAIAQNLPRAADALAGPLHTSARAATIRRDLISAAARTARHGRGNLTLHPPEHWHREHEWRNLWDAVRGPPAAAA